MFTVSHCLSMEAGSRDSLCFLCVRARSLPQLYEKFILRRAEIPLLKYIRVTKGFPMKNLLILAMLATSVAACSSSPKTFAPAYGSDFGYRNTQLAQDRFRVSYTSRDAYESRDFALLRAAQITSNEGYSHFKVINGDVYSNGPNRLGSHIGVGIGSGGFGRTRYNGHVGVAVDDVVRAVEGHKVTETIEVVLMTSAPQNDPNVFAADSIIRNIVPPKAP